MHLVGEEIMASNFWFFPYCSIRGLPLITYALRGRGF